MNETEARTVLLVRAFESPVEAPWSQADADAVTREAARDVGESASPEAFLARRAALAAGRLADRDAVASTALRHSAASLGASLALVALVVAFAIGFASDSVGANGRIDILAPPLLALLIWNLAVYAALLLAWARRRRPSGPAHPLRALLTEAVHRWLAVPRRAAGPWLRFAHDWADAARPLQTQRIAALLHGGAFAFACGALASLYLRGLVFEFRAGWDSTFLAPAAVHAWLSTILGPASALAHIALPSADALAKLRFSHGDGENAARWIHLYAITVVALVVWPRAWLAAAALRRAHRLARAFPIDLRGGDFQRLLRGRGGLGLAVRLLPYSVRPDAGALDRLKRRLERVGGQRVALERLATVEQGDEDDAAALTERIGTDDALLLILFATTATPERETHGRLLRTLSHAATARRQWVVLDEAAFVQRFAMSAPHRLAERRDAWSRLLREVGRTPLFVDLSTDAKVVADIALAAAFDAA